MGESAAAQPPRRGRSSARVAAFRLAGPVRRDDVPHLAGVASAALADCPQGIFDCDVGATDPPALPTIDVLARLALAARRTRRGVRLEHASPAILELVELCGLAKILRCDPPGGRAPGGRAPGGHPLDGDGRSGGEVVR